MKLRLAILLLFAALFANIYGADSLEVNINDIHQMDEATLKRLALLEQESYRLIEEEKYDSAYEISGIFLEEAYAANDYYGSVITAHTLNGYASAKIGLIQEAVNSLSQAHRNAIGSNYNLEKGLDTFDNLVKITTEEHYMMLEKQQKLRIAIVVVIALCLILILLIALYRQKHRLYTAIVKQNHEFIKQEKKSNIISGLSDDKRADIVQRLEGLMKEQQLYRENLLTRDRVAEILGTNRTYLSQILSEVYNKNFTDYINDLRIDEALHILDNPNNNNTIKQIGQDLGFNSVTTFNSQFQNRTGMTPAQYRQKIKLLDNQS